MGEAKRKGKDYVPVLSEKIAERKRKAIESRVLLMEISEEFLTPQGLADMFPTLKCIKLAEEQNEAN